MTEKERKDLKEFCDSVKILKEESYEDFIRIKSLTLGILIGRNKIKL